MLTGELASELQQARPADRVTVIVYWPGATGPAGVGFGTLKEHLLDRLAEMPGVRVNPLHGMPQAIVQAPASSWRAMLTDWPDLVADRAVQLVANRPIFHTLGT